MTTSPEKRDLINDIQGRLESRGWQAERGEGFRWVDHTVLEHNQPMHATCEDARA